MMLNDKAIICGEQLYDQAYMKVIWVIYELIIVISVIVIIIIWYKNRLSFPLMERSPYLSMYFLLNVMIYQLSYPIFLQSDYLSQNQDSLYLKCLFIPFQGSYTYIYLLKSFRLSWGFNIKRSGYLKKYEEYINSYFSKEWKLIISCIILLGLQICTGILPSSEEYQFDYVAKNIEENDIRILISKIIENYIGLTYLLLAIYIVRNVDQRVNIINELYVIFICDFITSSIRHILMMTNLYVSQNFCLQNAIPLLYLINWIKINVTVIVGMVVPLKMINIEHQYFNPSFIKQLGFILFYREDIFYKFILYCNQQNQIFSNINKSNVNNRANIKLFKDQILNSSPLSNIPKQDSLSFNDSNNQQHLTLLLSPSSQQINIQQNLNIQSDQVQSQENNTSQNYDLQKTRDDFLKRFDFDYVLGHYNIFWRGMKLKNQFENHNFEQFKQYFETLKKNRQIEKLFSKNYELMNQIYHWLDVDSFTQGINRGDSKINNTLSSSCIGVLGTFYQNNQVSSESNQQEDQLSRKQLQPFEIIQNIMKYSEEQLNPCFQEFKTTNSFQLINQNLKILLQEYTNLIQIKMAVDQDVSIQ